MAHEKFKNSRIKGTINLNLKFKNTDGLLVKTVNWVKDKQTLCIEIVDIVERFAKLDYKLTLRQLYYQLVKANAVRNHDTVYKKLSKILDDLRYGGYIDWDAVEDRGRLPKNAYSLDDAEDALNDAIRTFRVKRQSNQDVTVEVWSEKDAISEILYRVTSKYGIPLMINKGYSSSTAMYRGYQRFARSILAGKPVKLIYFGDHDPSGLDMIRDIHDRVVNFMVEGDLLKTYFDNLYSKQSPSDRQKVIFQVPKKDIDKFMSIRNSSKQALFYYKCWKTVMLKQLFEVIPAGINKKQIEQFRLPPNPAKNTDPRADRYKEEHGDESWEVDGLDPPDMVDILEQVIQANISMSKYQDIRKFEKDELTKLQKIEL